MIGGAVMSQRRIRERSDWLQELGAMQKEVAGAQEAGSRGGG
jgi:hypothetical protein